jgi:hypothetical protein
MIAALSILALLLVVGEAAVIRRAIVLTEQRLQLAEAEAAGLMCRRCGRLLRPGLLSPYPRPCPCRTRRPRHVSI